MHPTSGGFWERNANPYGSDERIYCSELVWNIFDRALGISVGKLESLGDFDLSSPAVKEKVKERWGESVPLDEDVIPPELAGWGSNFLFFGMIFMGWKRIRL